MKLYIPAIGDRLTLTAPWKFRLFLEHRNLGFAKNVGLLEKDFKGYGVYEGDRRDRKLVQKDYELPAGTVIECNRVYIRQYNRSRVDEENDYDSITWVVKKLTGKENRGKPHGRFWVKLPDVYEVEYDLDPAALYRNRVKLAKLIMET